MKKVAVYSTPTCHFCHDVKEFLKTNNIPFSEYDVQADAVRRDEMIAKTGKLAVPVVIITEESGAEEVIVGFDQDKLASLLLGA